MASFGGCLTIATLVLLSMVAGSQGNNALANQFTTWTPKNCEFTPDGRGVDLIVRNQSMREYQLAEPWISVPCRYYGHTHRHVQGLLHCSGFGFEQQGYCGVCIK